MAKKQSKGRPGKGGENHQPPPQEKVIVKKKSGCFPALLLLIAVIALIIWLMSHFNIGFFGKNGSGDKNSSNTSSDSVSANDSTDSKKVDKNSSVSDDDSEKIIDITVTGSQYYYSDGKTEIDNFIKEIKDMEGAVSVRITDDNAYYEYMQSLKDALTQENIPFTERSADISNDND